MFRKAKECGFYVVSIVFDGASTNVKVAKKIRESLNENENDKLIPVAQLKLKTSFECGE